METVCHNQLIFESLFNKEVVADFTGGRITSDAVSLLLRELDHRYRLAENLARCLHDPREDHKVKHDLLTLVRQRLFAIAQGYEDNNDAAILAKDPTFKIMAGKAPESAADLASQRTLSRFENRVTTKDLRRLANWGWTSKPTNCLFWLLWRHLQGTELATAQVNTLRLKLLKTGARLPERCRCLWVLLASGYPYRELLALVLQEFRASPA